MQPPSGRMGTRSADIVNKYGQDPVPSARICRRLPLQGSFGSVSNGRVVSVIHRFNIEAFPSPRKPKRRSRSSGPSANSPKVKLSVMFGGLPRHQTTDTTLARGL